MLVPLKLQPEKVLIAIHLVPENYSNFFYWTVNPRTSLKSTHFLVKPSFFERSFDISSGAAGSTKRY